MPNKLLPLLLAWLLAACSALPTPAERRQRADRLATEHGWQRQTLSVGAFDLIAYAPMHFAADEPLTVYIEGDGFAWLDAATPSTDPTPRDPLALRLALAQPGGNAAYLARPCQYVDAEQGGCPQRYWTEGRFAPEVIAASDRALDRLKAQTGARRLTLVGYSGGGAVAALLAARREDVERLVTVAGNLDHRAWTRHHRIAPLVGSLNAADEAIRLAHLPQTHFVGGRDRVIPLALAQEWPLVLRQKIRVIPAEDHACCWPEHWTRLWQEIQ